jgi:hypothetical protein
MGNGRVEGEMEESKEKWKESKGKWKSRKRNGKRVEGAKQQSAGEGGRS